MRVSANKRLFRSYLPKRDQVRLFPRPDRGAEAVSLPGKFAFPRIALRPVERTDVEDGDDEAAITRPLAAIGRDAHEMPDPLDRLESFYACLAARGDARQILDNRGNERMREIRERPADIVRLEWDYTCYRRCEPAEA